VAKSRTDLLTTAEMYELDRACALIDKAFGECPYLVGTAGLGGADRYRDVDVRLMLDDDEFAAACPTRERWELLCLTFSAYLRERTGLPVDFQIQRVREANERHGDKPRNPLGMGRVFAGGGDGTPAWESIDTEDSGQQPGTQGRPASSADIQGSSPEPVAVP
jgi:hypothetical protein